MDTLKNNDFQWKLYTVQKLNNGIWENIGQTQDPEEWSRLMSSIDGTNNYRILDGDKIVAEVKVK